MGITIVFLVTLCTVLFVLIATVIDRIIHKDKP